MQLFVDQALDGKEFWDFFNIDKQFKKAKFP